jgi:uncharacterized protein with PQ loop repeat
MKSVYFLVKKTGITSIEGFSMVVISLIILTPFCGFLFDCGCTWPWSGLESHCNIHDPLTGHQCPWCASLVAGVFSSAAAVLASLFATTTFVNSLSQKNHSVLSPQFLLALTIGLAAFLIVATITGWASGAVQDYPVFITKTGL